MRQRTDTGMRIPHPGYETSKGKRTPAANAYYQRCTKAPTEESKRNSLFHVSMTIDENRNSVFTYVLKDPETEVLKRNINKALQVAELQRLKDFFRK